ncbi:hypothetical protein GLYMA_13G259150v4 [Glycine max]|nr:hypothetical protein GLYMA_13G259150v4 [Glycine max]KAH1103418.1 hypothetical protein GYH30_037396 [Glycine max]
MQFVLCYVWLHGFLFSLSPSAKHGSRECGVVLEGFEKKSKENVINI